MAETVSSYCPICNAELHTYILDAEEAAEFVTLRQRIAELEATIATADLDYKIIRENIANERQRIEKLQANSALGKLVRRMPELWYYFTARSASLAYDNHSGQVKWTVWWDCSSRYTAAHDSPEAALREALPEVSNEVER